MCIPDWKWLVTEKQLSQTRHGTTPHPPTDVTEWDRYTPRLRLKMASGSREASHFEMSQKRKPPPISGGSTGIYRPPPEGMLIVDTNEGSSSRLEEFLAAA